MRYTIYERLNMLESQVEKIDKTILDLLNKIETLEDKLQTENKNED